MRRDVGAHVSEDLRVLGRRSLEVVTVARLERFETDVPAFQDDRLRRFHGPIRRGRRAWRAAIYLETGERGLGAVSTRDLGLDPARDLSSQGLQRDRSVRKHLV